jgi:hypothetical protein
VTNMRTNQTPVEGTSQGMRDSVLGRSVEMNIKLIRNAMFVTAVIVTISLMGKASAHDGVSPAAFSAGHAVWVVEDRR